MKYSIAAVAGTILILPLFVLIGLNIYLDATFEVNCGGHLKRAADANSVEIAEKELKMVLEYADRYRLTTGNTSVIYNTPDNDVEFWYNNLKTSHDELLRVNAKTSQLERTNILMKLRETLMDHGKEGDYTTVPGGIEKHPFNTLFIILIWTFILFAAIGVFFWFIAFGN